MDVVEVEVCEVLEPPAGGDDGGGAGGEYGGGAGRDDGGGAGGDDGGGAGGDEDDVVDEDEEDEDDTALPRGVLTGTGVGVPEVPLGWVDELPAWKISFCAPSWKLYRSL